MENGNQQETKTTCTVYEKEQCDDSLHCMYNYYTQIFVPSKSVIITCTDPQFFYVRRAKRPEVEPEIIDNGRYLSHVRNIRQVDVPTAFIEAAIRQHEANEALRASVTEEVKALIV